MMSWFGKVFRGDGSAKLIHRLLAEHGRSNWKRYAAAFVFMGIAAGCTAMSAFLIGKVVNEAYVARSFSGVVSVSVLVIVIFTLKGLSNYGQAVILARIGNRIVALNQRRMFDKLLQQGLAYFADRHSSEFMARLGYAANAASQVLNLMITAIGRDVLTLIGLIGVMVYQDPVLSLIGLVVMPPAVLVLRKMIKRVRNIVLTQYGGNARVLETMQETIRGFRVVKAFNLEEEMRKRIDRDVDTIEQAANKLARVSNRSSPMMESLGGIAIALVLLYGGYRVLVMNATPGEFVSFITAFLLAYEPAKRLARLNIDLHNGLVGVQMLFELLDSPPTERDDAGSPELRISGGRIEFSDVTFSYRATEDVLCGLSFVAEPGQVTALVGPSGGGKTTVLNLLLRFYDVGGGRILIDGQDIAQVRRRSLRERLAYVGQDVFLFRGTVRDNIAWGRPGAGENEIVAAAQAAFAHDFIMEFPAGYDTPVGEHGAQLSGGQRQRIAIARALIKDAPIVLLDEPTASLDSESEKRVQDAIARLCEGRTTLVIAHRLHTIAHADRIHVIEKGRVVESGRHEPLLRAGGRYADFFRLQFRDMSAQDRVVAIGARSSA